MIRNSKIWGRQMFSQIFQSARQQTGHSALGPLHSFGNIRQRTSLQMSQPHRFALVCGKNFHGAGKLHHLFAAHGVHRSCGLVGLWNDCGCILSGIDRLFAADGAFLSMCMIADGILDVLFMNLLYPSEELGFLFTWTLAYEGHPTGGGARGGHKGAPPVERRAALTSTRSFVSERSHGAGLSPSARERNRS